MMRIMALDDNNCMQVCELKENRPEYLLGEVRYEGESYGDKFEKFNAQIYQAFERIARIKMGSKIPERMRLPLALLAAILFIKNHRCFSDDYKGIDFIENSKGRQKEIAVLAPQLNLEKLMNFFRSHILSPTRLQLVIPGEKAAMLAGELCELMNAVAEVKGKEVENYNQEQMRKISSFFGEKVFLINYDYNKGALSERTLSHKYIYLLKAKDLYFILFKEQDIEIIDKGTLSHEELAVVFNIESKLERPKNAPKSPTKSSNLKSSSSGQSESSTSRLKASILFPDDVKCTPCGKVVSEFNAIFWNYSYYCFSCVMSPKIDISFIPASIIEKFLKNQKNESREYQMVCSECKSDTIIANYRPWDKPKSYKCKACQKQICVEHQRMLGECFCHCQKCDKRTLSIPNLCAKLCLVCRMRHCEICNARDKKPCSCICPDCGENKKMNHEECKPRCHQCQAREVTLCACRCARKLCGLCYFGSLQPKSTICGESEAK